MTNPIDTLLEPFQGIDIATTYQSHGVLIDFVIYVVIFTGLTRFVFSKRFPDRGGRAITIGVAIALSAGMAVFSSQTGFRLGNLGSIAAILLLALFGVLIFALVKHLGGHTANSGIIAFLAAYMITRAAFPEVYEWAAQAQFARWLDAAVLLAIPVLVVLLVVRNKPAFLQGLGKRLTEIPKNPQAEQAKREELKGLQTAKQEERQAYKDEKHALLAEKATGKDIDTLISILKKEGATPKTVPRIRAILAELQREDNELAGTLNRLKAISDKLQQWDITSFHALSDLYNRQNPDERKKLKDAILAERDTIIERRTIQQAEQRVAELRQAYLNQLSQANNALAHQNATEAIGHLSQAKKTQQEAQTLLSQLKHMEKRIFRLTRAETAMVQHVQA